jgi:hypothetical protein
LSPSEKQNDYHNFVIAQIEQEFEIKFSPTNLIFRRNVGSYRYRQNATIQMMRLAAKNEDIKMLMWFATSGYQ